MLSYVYHALEDFRSCFSRQRSWLLFGTVVVSFLTAPEMIRVTSRYRFWRSDEHGYQRLFHVDETAEKGTQPRLAERVVQMALALARRHERPSLLVLDALFSTAGVFRLARSGYSIACRRFGSQVWQQHTLWSNNLSISHQTTSYERYTAAWSLRRRTSIKTLASSPEASLESRGKA